jgi:hypothetical protein
VRLDQVTSFWLLHGKASKQSPDLWSMPLSQKDSRKKLSALGFPKLGPTLDMGKGKLRCKVDAVIGWVVHFSAPFRNLHLHTSATDLFRGR